MEILGENLNIDDSFTPYPIDLYMQLSMYVNSGLGTIGMPVRIGAPPGDYLDTLVQFLILSDIHANWHALEAVLADVEGKFQQIICCGDIVGYNPRPAEVLEWTKAYCAYVIRGNHDKVVAGIDDLEWFNQVAQAAALWTREQLSDGQLEYLRELQMGPLKLEHFHIWHGSPLDEDEYLTTPPEASPCFAAFEMPLAFFGHTHLQGGFFRKHRRTGRIARGSDGAPGVGGSTRAGHSLHD